MGCSSDVGPYVAFLLSLSVVGSEEQGTESKQSAAWIDGGLLFFSPLPVLGDLMSFPSYHTMPLMIWARVTRGLSSEMTLLWITHSCRR